MTRFLPATKAKPKELMPIVDKPLIRCAAEEAIAAIGNDEHRGKGFVFTDPRLEGAEFKDGDHVARLYATIMSQFPDRNSAKAAE